jgi:hypothetical protein
VCPFHYERGHEVTALRGDKDQTSHRHHGGSQIKLAEVLRGLLFGILGMVNTFPQAFPWTVTRPRAHGYS